jgi:hypothetical protein
MGGGFDESVRVALRERAEGTVMVEQLLAGARRRGVRRRRVRHALFGGGTALAVVLASVVVILRLPAEAELEAAEIRSVSTLPRPPVAQSRDTNVLRLDVADPAVQWLEWTAESDGRQRLEVHRGQPWDGSYNGHYTVMRGRSEDEIDSMLDGFEPPNSTTEQVTIGGAGLALMASGVFDDGGRWASLRWRRPDGTWLGAYVAATTIAGSGPQIARNAILQVPQWVRVKVSYRCVADFRLAWTPPGTRPAGCRLGISADGRFYGILFATANQGTFLAYTEAAANPDAVRSIDRWLAGFMGNGDEHRYGDRVFAVGGPGLSNDDIRQVIGGFTELKDPVPVR